jgi:hypothetical protein
MNMTNMSNMPMRTSMLLLCSATLMACFPPPPGGGGAPPPSTPDAGGGGNPGSFDAATFASEIQPMLDRSGCIGGCHNTTSRLGNFGMTANAAAGSAEIAANLEAVVARIDTSLSPDAATQAKIYVKATDMHGPVISDTNDLNTLRDWIADGLGGGGGGDPDAGPGGGGGADAFDAAKFDLSPDPS